MLVVERVIPPGNGPDRGNLPDINMMVGPGGQQRGRGEFQGLFSRSGLRLNRVIPTPGPLNLLEAVKA